MHFTFPKSDLKRDFKNRIISMTNKNIFFKVKPYKKHAISYFIDYNNEFINDAIKNSQILNHILKLSPETILFYSKHLKLQTTLFNNNLKFTTSLPSSINNTKIKEQISKMKIITQNILKTEFQITDPLIFIQF